jgi:hypothetical protein
LNRRLFDRHAEAVHQLSELTIVGALRRRAPAGREDEQGEGEEWSGTHSRHYSPMKLA